MSSLYKYKNWFLNAYIINAIFVLLFKLVLGLINEDVLSDILIMQGISLIYASFKYTDGFMYIHVDGVGPLAILLIVFFVLTFCEALSKVFIKDKNISIIYKALSMVFGAIIFLLTLFVKNFHMPFSLLESIAITLILLPLITIIKKIDFNDKLCKIICIFLIIVVSIAGYLYQFLDYFIEW